LSSSPLPSTWTAFLASLPLWERSLFPDVTVLDLSALLSALADNADLYLASDGGAIPLKGSFGAVLATDDAILVECGGRAYGQDPRSFRSEAYGMLAITRLLLHLRRYHHYNSHRMNLTLVCDAKSLLDRLTASRDLTRVVPRRFLFSEADAEVAILDSFQELKADIILEHVESRQDTKYPNRPPTWEAILNSCCDAIASDKLASATDVLRKVPFVISVADRVSVRPRITRARAPTRSCKPTNSPQDGSTANDRILDRRQDRLVHRQDRIVHGQQTIRAH
jgi:hypothetical protein